MSARFLSIIVVIFLLPFLGFMGLGLYWLWEHNWLYQASGIAIANSLLIFVLLRSRSEKIKSKNKKPSVIFSDENWIDNEKLVSNALETVKERWINNPALFINFKKNAVQLTMEVLFIVAKHFHANSKSKYPLLAFSLPILLKFITLVCNDIQREVLDRIPGSHTLNLGELLLAKELFDGAMVVKNIYDAGKSYNVFSFLMWKMNSLLDGKSISYIKPEISQFVVSKYVDILGKYAIQLYSGQITLDDIDPTSILTSDSKADKKACAENEKTLEPLRILVLGQVSSGKSSLINALFGEVKSAVSVLPTTSEITPYILERDGLQQAIILDSAGYGGLTDNILPDDLKKEWTKIDIILMVCSASNAARSADAAQLNAVRHYFQAQRKQVMPVVIGVATHIDRLRPLQEWQPPYNIENPDTSKAKNIRAFCEAIAKDLSLPLENIVPVCLNPQTDIYNINEGLIPKIYEELKDDTQRVRYLRCLRYQQDKSYWQQLGKQALGLGRVFFG